MSDLHAKIINLECKEPDLDRTGVAPAYRLGHRDARHAAAELAAMEAARIEALEAALAKADALADAVINERDADTTQSLIILGRAHYDYRVAREATK